MNKRMYGQLFGMCECGFWVSYAESGALHEPSYGKGPDGENLLVTRAVDVKEDILMDCWAVSTGKGYVYLSMGGEQYVLPHSLFARIAEGG